jgi:pyruvate ferredoxin oxidoreductase alpha subunit
MTLGALDFSDFYFEHKVSQLQGMLNSPRVILEVGQEFYKKFDGEGCYEFYEAHQMKDAEMAIIVLGSTAGATRMVVDDLRSRGVAAGMIKIRSYRPFPYDQIAKELAGVKAVAVLDRSIAYGADGGPVHGDVRAALYGKHPVPVMSNYIYGLGGKPIDMEHIMSVFDDLKEAIVKGRPKRRVDYLNLKEGNIPLLV